MPEVREEHISVTHTTARAESFPTRARRRNSGGRRTRRHRAHRLKRSTRPHDGTYSASIRRMRNRTCGTLVWADGFEMRPARVTFVPPGPGARGKVETQLYGTAIRSCSPRRTSTTDGQPTEFWITCEDMTGQGPADAPRPFRGHHHGGRAARRRRVRERAREDRARSRR